MREILVVLARAAESVAERDQRYAAQFGEFTKRLQALAKLEDLPQFRAAIVRGAKELKTCIDRMDRTGARRWPPSVAKCQLIKASWKPPSSAPRTTL